MMVDWVSASLDWTHAREAWAALHERADRICRYTPSTGAVEWECAAWDQVRSDSHQVLIHVESDCVRVQGSPARCIGDGDAVFSSGASAALDLVGCLDAMLRHVAVALDVVLPRTPSLWRVTRVDVTENLQLESLEDVRAALAVLRDCEGGRYRVSQQAGDTVYWSHRSTVRGGKAYAKGPHLRYLSRQKSYDGRRYSLGEIDAAGSLLRLELKLARAWFRDCGMSWFDLDAEHLRGAWEHFFLRMVGDAEMNDSHKLRATCQHLSTKRQGAAAYSTLLLIRELGWDRARDQMSRSTFYRHIKILRAAGLGDADISAGRIVELRRIMSARPVSSWGELRAVA